MNAGENPNHSLPEHVPNELVLPYNWHGEPDFDPDDLWTARAELLETAPRIFWNPVITTSMLPTGNWVLTRDEDVRYVLQNDGLFSSRGLQSEAVGPVGDVGVITVMPLELSGALHKHMRALLREFFGPAQVGSWSGKIRDMAKLLLDKIEAKGEADFVVDFARPYPVLIFLSLIGMDTERFDEFLEWEYAYLHSPDPEKRAWAGSNVVNYFQQLIADRKADPQDDIFSKIVHSEIDGRPIEDKEILGISFNLFTGGLDTHGLLNDEYHENGDAGTSPGTG
jgi:cytochrome P450